MAVSSIVEVERACSILFGSHVRASLDFIKYLQPSGLKAAYRKKAFETHPDRACAVGEDRDKMAALFLEATLAYHHLLPIIKSNGSPLFRNTIDLNKPRPKEANKGRTQASGADHFYTGTLPRRKLLIGQVLYYSSMISWKALIDAIVWQRGLRPSLGQLAHKWKKLSHNEIQVILSGKQLGEKFGECAIRSGYLTRFEVMALIGFQVRLQRPIGEYFLRQNILGPRDMERMLRAQQAHNRRISPKNRF